MCGTCCYGEGGIFVEMSEIDKIAGFLGISPESFTSKFCREKDGRFWIDIGGDKFCIFYEEKKCRINPVKPGICSLWPFYPGILRDEDTWEAAKDACPGINPDCPFDDFVRQAKELVINRRLTRGYIS